MTIEQALEPPFNRHLGIQVEQWSEGRTRISATVRDEFTNSHGLPHGGYICSLLDVAATLPGLYCPHPNRVRRALTLSLNTSFVGQAQSRQLYALGRVTKAGYKTFFSYAEVFDDQDNLLATAQSVLKYRKGSESLDGVSLKEWETQKLG